MATGTKKVGNWGEIRVIVDQVSQNTANNTSQVRVRGQMRTASGARSFNNNGVPMTINGTNGITSRATSTPFDVSGSWKTVRDETYTVTHDSNGSRTVTGRFVLGNTSTTVFGSGGTASVSLALTKINRAPSAPPKPTVSNVTADGITVNWGIPSNTGGGILEYQVRFYRATGNAWQDHKQTNRSRRYTGLTHNTTYRARVRARSAGGWGPWSAYWSGKTAPKPPNTPGTPTVSNITSSSARVAWSAPANNGAGIVEYQVQRATNSAFTAGVVSASGITGTSYNRTGLAGRTDYWVRVRARNSAGWSGWSGGRKFTTPVAKPNTPTNVTATYQSDNAQLITWSLSSTSAAPVESQRVQRNHWTGTERTEWATIATISNGTARSYTDTTTTKHNDYRYRIVAVNTAGQTPSDMSNRVRTTPAPPVIGNARKSGNNIRVTYTQTMTPDEGTANEIYDKPDDGYWVHIGTTANPSEFIHANPDPNISHQYRVRTRDTLHTTLFGDWSGLSNKIQLQGPPEAPINLQPNGGYVLWSKPTTLSWEHNPVDGTDQTQFELRYRYGYGAFVELSGTTSESVTIPAMGGPGWIEWSVRTMGGHPEWSPWTHYARVDLTVAPEATILSPTGGLYERQILTLRWDYSLPGSPNAGQAGWEAELRDSNNTLLSAREGSTTQQTAFPYPLSPETEYYARVRVKSTQGFWSDWVTTTIETPSETQFIDTPELIQPKNYTVVNDAISRDVSSTEGGADQVTVEINEDANTRSLLGRAVRIRDYQNKPYVGVVRQIGSQNGDVTIQADGLVALMNADKEFEAGTFELGDLLQGYVQMVYHVANVDALGDLANLPVVDYGGFGNLWERLRELCAVMKIDILTEDNVITFVPMDVREVTTRHFSSEGWGVDVTNTARQIKVHYYDLEMSEEDYDIEAYPFGENEDAQIIQVDAGQREVVEITVDAWLSEINQPICEEWVDNDDYSGTQGVYSVVGNDNLPIKPNQWLDAGGDLRVRKTDDPEVLEIVVTGAGLPELAPFRIAMSSGNHYNSLHITGQGARFRKHDVVVHTGTSTAVTGEDIGAEVDSRWITSRSAAFDVAARVAKAYAGPNMTFDGQGQKFDVSPVGARIEYGDAVFRIRNVSITPDGIQVSANESTSIGEFNEVWDGKTIADFNQVYSGRIMREFAQAPLRRNFE